LKGVLDHEINCDYTLSHFMYVFIESTGE